MKDGGGEFSEPPTEVDLPEREPPFVSDPVAPLRSDAEIAALVDEGMPLVPHVARAVLLQIGTRLDLDELRGVGHEALFAAARSFDPSRSAFGTYARKKLRWAMLNEVRKVGDARAQRRAHALRAAERVREALEGEPVDADLPASSHARALRAQIAAQAAALAVGLSVRPTTRTEEELDRDVAGRFRAELGLATPEEQLGSAAIEAALRAALPTLLPRQREIIERHYFGGERFDRIATDMGVSKSWLSRLHQQAMNALAKLLADHR